MKHELFSTKFVPKTATRESYCQKLPRYLRHANVSAHEI